MPHKILSSLQKPAVILLFFALGLSPSSAVKALSAASTHSVSVSNEAPPEIVVIGLKDPFSLKADQLNSMLSAFYDKRDRLAPHARLFLEIRDLGDGLPNEAKFSLNGPKSAITLPSDTAMRIYFPETRPSGGPFTLTSNLPRQRVGIALWVMSPGTSQGKRTIGDLRLQCEVMWAAAKFNMSTFVRALFGAAGACRSSKIAFYFRSGQPLKSGLIRVGNREIPVQVGKNQLAYRAPIWDASIPNDAVVALNFN